MTKAEYLGKLRARLEGLPELDIQNYLAYYEEMIDDRMEAGMREAQAVAELADPEAVAREILMEHPPIAARARKAWPTWAVALVSVTALLLVMATAFTLLSGFFWEDPEWQELRLEEELSDIFVSVGGTDLEILPTDQNTCSVVYQEDPRTAYKIGVQHEGVEKGLLYVSEQNNQKWYDYLRPNPSKRTVYLFLPAGAYASLSADTASGNILCEGEGLSFQRIALGTASGNIRCDFPATEELNVSSASGEIEVAGQSPRWAFLSSASGNMSLSNVLAEKRLQAQSSSGSITLNRCDGGEVALESSSGDIRGSLLSDKLFEIETVSGNVACPPSVKDGGLCSITTASGSVSIQIEE